MAREIADIEIRIGCAGWSIPKAYASKFPAAGTHLVRYAGRFNAVEINSSFYKPHKPTTYLKWAESVPNEFRFAVKVPQEVTHTRRLIDVDEVLDRFLDEVKFLGHRLGPLLVQLPPSLQFCRTVADEFLQSLRQKFAGDVVVEPRHESWFETKVDELLAKYQVARVAADPALVKTAALPGGWTGLEYFRLHGSPQIYYSDYSEQYLDALAQKLSAAASRSVDVWCIFDNTAVGAATANALNLNERVV